MAPVKRANLLPEDATRRERVYADVDGRLDDIDADLVRRVKDPAAAPVAYLPYLAWERSVDVYDPAWPESVRRAVVAAAPEVQRYKGSVHAVRTALAALRVQADVVEWWQETPRAAPYTFRVTAYAQAPLYDGPLLDARLIRIVYAAIDRAKPLSRAYTLTVAASLPAGLALTAVTMVRGYLRAEVRPGAGEIFAADIALTAVHVVRGRINLVLDTRLNP